MKKVVIIFLIGLVALGCKKSSTPQTKVLAPKTYTITASSSANGTISPSGAHVVDSGASPGFIITPTANYGLASLYIDGQPIDPVTFYEFKDVKANHSISANFAQAVNIALTVENGSVSYLPMPGAVGGTIILTLTPQRGYHPDSIWVNGTGAKLGNANTYTIANITAIETITVRFLLTQAQVDSLSNLLIGQWKMTSYQERIAKSASDNYFNWSYPPIESCAVNNIDQYFSNGVYQRTENCPPGYQLVRNPMSDHWAIKNDGRTIYMTDPPRDSLYNATITKDSLIAYYFDKNSLLMYLLHFARKQ